MSKSNGQQSSTGGTISSEALVVQFRADKKACQAHELDLRQKEMAYMHIVHAQRRESIKEMMRATYD